MSTEFELELYLAKDITKVESMQRIAVRFTMNDHMCRSSMSNMLERLGWEPFQECRAVAWLATMKKMLCFRVAINCNDCLERSTTQLHGLELPIVLRSSIIVPEEFQNSFLIRAPHGSK